MYVVRFTRMPKPQPERAEVGRLFTEQNERLTSTWLIDIDLTIKN